MCLNYFFTFIVIKTKIKKLNNFNKLYKTLYKSN